MPHIHQQNGRVEHFNHTIIDKAEAIRTHSSCPRSWWEFAVETAVHIYNCTPLERTKWKTPFENLYSKQPDVKYLRTFGCLAWVFIPKEIRKDKLSPKAEPMTFIGYENGSKAYKFMRKDNSIFIGVKAIFNENSYPRSENPTDKQSPTGIQDLWADENPNIDDGSDNDSDSQQHSIDIEIDSPTIGPNKNKVTNHHNKNQDDTPDITQYFSPDDDDNSESNEDKQTERDQSPVRPQTPERRHALPPPKTPKKQVRVQTPPQAPLRRSTRVRKPVLKTGSVYGERKATDILKNKNLLQEIFNEESDIENSPAKAGPSKSDQILEEIAKDNGNDAVHFLLSKAIQPEETLPVTYKDVDKLKNKNLQIGRAHV